MAKSPALKVKVENMLSHAGREVANQFLIHTDNGVYFQSYSSIIAYRPFGGQVILDKNFWEYSVTTGKYRNKFLHENTAETRQKIANGTYALADLNN